MPARHSRAEVLDRENQAVDLRRNGATYRQIGKRLGVTDVAALLMVRRALERHQAESVPEVRKLELDRLDQLFVSAMLVLQRPHYVVQGGKIVYGQEGQGPLVDDAPVLQAVRTLLQIQERRARLLGLDAPTKVDMKVFTVDQMDARIEELQALLAANDRDPQPRAG